VSGVVINTNVLGAPAWMADFGSRDHLEVFPARLVASAFKDANGVLVKANGVAAAAAVAITVDALSGPIPSGTLLYFGETGEFALTTADAAAGATSISVQALPQAIEDNDEAVYSPTGRVTVKSGTLVGRTFAERDANTGFGPADSADDEIYLLAFDVVDALNDPDCTLYRNGSRVKENYLPDWTAISANAPLLADLRANYKCFKGTD
jgi:hypothetical protein